MAGRKFSPLMRALSSYRVISIMASLTRSALLALTRL